MKIIFHTKLSWSSTDSSKFEVGRMSCTRIGVNWWEPMTEESDEKKEKDEKESNNWFDALSPQVLTSLIQQFFALGVLWTEISLHTTVAWADGSFQDRESVIQLGSQAWNRARRFQGGVADDYGKATNQVAFYRTAWWANTLQYNTNTRLGWICIA